MTVPPQRAAEDVPEPTADHRVAESPSTQPAAAPTTAGADHAEPAPADDDDTHEVYSIGGAFGGPAGLLDTGLPSIVFLVAYTTSGSDLQLALILALACGGLLAVFRLIRRHPLQHVIGGFFGVALAAYIANRTGRPQDIYLPGLFINVGYALAYAVSILVRWPLIGLLVAAVQQQDLGGWRRDPVLLRAYSRASWLWVAMFVLRLAVQLPLYLAGESALVALGIARVAMGWPLFLVTAWLTYLVIKASVPAGYRVRKLPSGRSATPAASPPA